MVVSFFQFLHSHVPSREGEDVMHGSPRKHGLFDS